MIAQGASDLHLSAGLAPRMRIDGEVVPLDWPSLSATQVADLLSPILNKHQLYSAIQTGGALGMKTLDMSLKGLVGQGLINREEARGQARVPADI